MTGWRRGVVWAVAAAAGLTCAGVTLLLWLKDLSTAGIVAGLAADTVTLVMTVFAVRALVLQSAQTTSQATASGAGSVAAGGSIGRAVTGSNNQRTGGTPTPAPGSPAPGGRAEASGTKSVAAGGSIGEAVTGDGNST
ncbi:hypothetical protein [Streptomyces pseudovenezuelae]|uniref:hypothetical protein n=1 Tax=Streptomyces pseudovenezuelae TaxID=67350 RepID=UPI002E346C03|nr:hypothetical protein [Streptomyces pseudovenezuelae]